ncbi:MAG: hypothetical protein IKS65_05640 [Bacteroidales bacterium]|nr:hypothetical protein [Bacteroidales bacterium]
MEENDQIPTFSDVENPKPERPFGLSLFCVLSFINAVYQFFIGIGTFLVFGTLKDLTEDENYLEMMDKFGVKEGQYEQAMAAILNVGRSYYLYTALLYVASFIGVLYMWRQLKKGFHIYAIAQILVLIIEVLMFDSVTGSSPWGGVIITAVFIAIYYNYYKKVLQ